MGSITIVKEMKHIHPKDIALIRRGGFYRTYGRDAYILSNLFEYKIKKEEEVLNCSYLAMERILNNKILLKKV